ncbi:chemotaxis protein [Arcobacter sp. 15-2]|uniref:chemotaxis protein CheV n=1 Tax=Arcobacter sp. 15-2 TaxID=3374109 RepID=UPI00399C7FCF
MSGISDSVEQLTQAHLRNVQQLAVFYTGHGEMYAINIAKIKAFIITEEITITDTPTDTDVIQGIATIRGEPITLINLDRWLGYESLPVNEYKLIIFCEFNHKQVGFLVKDMVNIVEKTTAELINSENQNSKVTYTTYVEIDKKDNLCTVFNAEQLLSDIGWTDINASDLERYITRPLNDEKIILIAEDSAVAREVMIQFMKKAKANYIMSVNGGDLLDRLEEIGDPSKIGVVITDIEMPGTDGYQVAKYIKETQIYNHIPVIVNSSMTTDAVKDKMNRIGIDGFVGKTDVPTLYRLVSSIIGTK